MALPVLLLGASVVRPELLSFSRINTMGEVSAPAYRSFPIRAGDIEYERWALDAARLESGACVRGRGRAGGVTST